MKRETGLLYGKEAIRDYLKVSEFILNKLINSGLPVLIDDRIYMAHTDNIEEWVRKRTRTRSRVPERKKKPVNEKDI